MTDTVFQRPKDITNTQFGRVSTPDGNCTVPAADTNDGKEPLLDADGRLIVRLADQNGFLNTNTGRFTNAAGLNAGVLSDAIYSTQYLLTFGPGSGLHILYDLIGHNHHPTDLLYLQFFPNLLGPLVGGEHCQVVVPVPGTDTNFSLATPIEFTEWMTIALSTTPLIWTDPGAHYLFFYGHAR